MYARQSGRNVSLLLGPAPIVLSGWGRDAFSSAAPPPGLRETADVLRETPLMSFAKREMQGEKPFANRV
jgi:hypothetical protein